MQLGIREHNNITRKPYFLTRIVFLKKAGGRKIEIFQIIVHRAERQKKSLKGIIISKICSLFTELETV